MATASTVNTWKDAETAYWAASVVINNHDVEFIATTPLSGMDESGNPVRFTDDQIAGALQADMTARVDAQLANTPQPFTDMLNGKVSI